MTLLPLVDSRFHVARADVPNPWKAVEAPRRHAASFKQHLQPRVVRRQCVGSNAAAGFCEDDLKRVDINQAVLARVLEVARVGVGL